MAQREIRIHYPTDGEAVTMVDGAQTVTVPAWRSFSELATLHSGRLNLLPAAMSQVPQGAVQFQRADGAWLLDMSGIKEALDLILPEGVYRGVQSGQKRGFAQGELYWLAKDANGQFLPKPGRFHRKIYVTGSASAYTRAKIAEHAGVSETTVTGSWLAARPQYGGTSAMALGMDAYYLLMAQLNGRNKTGRSDWVLLERGYSYGSLKPSGDQGYSLKGESEMHPLVFDAWGAGADPTASIGFEKMGPQHFFARNISFTYFEMKYAANVIISGGTQIDDEYFQFSDVWGATVVEANILDHRKITPAEGQLRWDGSGDRSSGIYFTAVEGVALVGNLIAVNGWGRGYDYNMSTDFPMSPSDRNHGIYGQFTSGDVTIRDNWIIENSSAGQQVRTGGLFERNNYLDNNYATGGGAGSDLGSINQFIQEYDLVVFGAGFKRVLSYEGIINGAFRTGTPRHTRRGAVVAHLANPDSPAEIAGRATAREPYLAVDAGYSINEVKIYKWKDKDGLILNENIGGLDTAILDVTTPHRWAGAKLGKTTATLPELIDWIKQRSMPIGKSAREFNDWVRTRYGYTVPSRTTAATVNFVPDEHGEGFRADNRYNWSTGDLPGRNTGDTMNLKGRFVRFGSEDHVVANMISEGGRADVTGGLLAPATIGDAADVAVRRSGYFRLGSAPHPLRITADSGFVHLMGTVAALDLIARGHAEVILGPNANIPAGKKLLLSGERVMVGWDGTGTATLTVAGTLEFRAGMRVNVAGGFLNRFMRTGNAVIGPDFTATLADYEEMSSGTNNRMHLCDVTGTPTVGALTQFGFRDIHNNTEDRVEILSKNIEAIGSAGLPQLQIFRSGFIGDGLTEPTVTASVALQAGSAIVVSGTHLLPSGYTRDLTGPGVTVTNPGGITLPAGVTLTGGKLVYTKP